MAPDVVRSRLRTLQQVLSDLQPHVHAQRTDQHREHYAIERQVQLAVDLSSGAARRVLSLQGYVVPDSAREVFLRLGREGLIEMDLANRLAAAAGLRNLILHEYGSVDLDRFFDGLEDGYHSFVDFVDAIHRQLPSE